MGVIMKKIVTTLIAGIILATTASADFARVEMGGGMWNQTPSGTMTYTDGGTINYVSDKKAESTAYAWMLVKHPIPVLPNFRFEYAKIKDTATISATGTIGDYTLTTPSTTASLEFTQYDVAPYYNLLDNTFWTTLDVGVDLKVLTTNYTADDVNVSGVANTQYTKSISLVLPMGYVRARVEIPKTNVALEVDGKYIEYDGSSIYDARVKIDYTLSFVPVVQPAIEIGYRVQNFDLKIDSDKTKIKLDFSGVYAGIMLRF